MLHGYYRFPSSVFAVLMRHTDASSLACLLRPRDQRFSRRYCYKSRKLKKFTSPHSIILIGAGEHRL
jgi:hypothetical protein